jgi:hypothetical protein
MSPNFDLNMDLIFTWPQRLSHEVGWGYKDVVDRLEEKRKIKAQAFHERKVCNLRSWSFGKEIGAYLSYCTRLLPSNCVKKPLLKSPHRSSSLPSWDTRVVTLLIESLIALCTLCTTEAR